MPVVVVVVVVAVVVVVVVVVVAAVAVAVAVVVVVVVVVAVVVEVEVEVAAVVFLILQTAISGIFGERNFIIGNPFKIGTPKIVVLELRLFSTACSIGGPGSSGGIL